MYFARVFISLFAAGRAIHDAGDVLSLVQLRATSISSSDDVDDVKAERDTLLQRIADDEPMAPEEIASCIDDMCWDSTAESTHRIENMDDMLAGDEQSETSGTEALAAGRRDVDIDFDDDVSDERRRRSRRRQDPNDAAERRRRSRRRDAAAPPAEGHDSDFQLCRANPPDGKRILISAVVEAFHGSTALEEVIMSSDKVTTPCSCGTWQCEVRWLKTADGGTAWTWNYTQVLGALSNCWDLEKKVFFKKFMLGNHCPTPKPGDTEDENHCRSRAVGEFAHRVQEAELPSSLLLAGVKEIEVIHVFMWRPLCLAHLSRYSQSMMDKGQGVKLTQIEIIAFKEMVIAHKKMKKAGHKVMVINLGSLIWEPMRSKARIERMMPCIGEVDMDFVPLLGRDIVKENEFKASGSVKEYGEKIDPSEFYDVMSGQCTDEFILDGLDEEESKKALEAIRYLRKHSQNELGSSEESEAEKLDVVVRGEE